MKLVIRTALVLSTFATAAMAQVITPVWVEHLNGEQGVSPANRLPILRKNPGAAENNDGTSEHVSFGKLLRYDSARFLLYIRENGINEPIASPADVALAALYPDASLIWINAANGAPLGIAHVIGVQPIAVTGQSSQLDFFHEWGLADDGTIYTGHKNVILRYAKTGTDTWSSTPTCAWTEPTVGALDCSGNALDDSCSGDGNQSVRWREFRVTGSGTNTKLFCGGGTWRMGSNPQLLVTTNGLTFNPVARLNNRDNGAGQNEYALGGQSTHVVRYGLDPSRPNLETVYTGHYPGAGYGNRPNRYQVNPDAPLRSITNFSYAMIDPYTGTNSVRILDREETGSGNLPAFSWEADGLNGVPEIPTVSGDQYYDGNWSCAMDANGSLDYIVNYSMPSWNNQYPVIDGTNYHRPGWIGVHRLDGSISVNTSWRLPCTEDDIIEPANGATVGNDWGYCGDITLYPDTTAPANLDKAMFVWSGGAYGFGVFTIQNVAAGVTTEPLDITVLAGTTNSLSAVISGSPNVYRWKKDGVPLNDGRFLSGSKKATLTLREVVKADAGSYQLEITNPLSGTTTTRAAKVTVVGAYVRPHQNAAIFGAASQISESSGGAASRAIDGNTNQVWGGGSVAHTGGAQTNTLWWEVDLLSTVDIGRVVYFPRSDCCDSRQAEVNVVILNAARTEVNRYVIGGAGNGVYAWPDATTVDYGPSVSGRYVRIERTPLVVDPPADDFLNIAEVQVFNVFRPIMDIGVYNGQIMVAWDADAFSTPKLQKSGSLSGPWTDVTTVTPFTGAISGTTFYKLVTGP